MKRNRLWQLGLGTLATLVVLVGGYFPGRDYSTRVQAQSAAPAAPSTPAPARATQPTPASTPATTPVPATPSTPTPARATQPTPTATPGATPAPATPSTPAPARAIQPTPTATPAPAPAIGLPENTLGLSLGEGTYKEDGRFEIGILDGYQVSSVAGVPIIESSDRSLAYTALIRQRATNQSLSPNALAQIALETLQGGEEFQPGAVQPVAPGAILLPWTGTLSANGVKPVSGRVFVRQVDRTVLMLVVCANEEGKASLDSAIAALAGSLQTPTIPISP